MTSRSPFIIVEDLRDSASLLKDLRVTKSRGPAYEKTAKRLEDLLREAANAIIILTELLRTSEKEIDRNHQEGPQS